MLNTLNFPTTTTITSTSCQPLTPPSKLNFPPNNPTFPSFSHPKPSKFPSFSLKITTFHPLKPSKTPPSPTTTIHPPKPSKTPPFHTTTTTTTPPPSKTPPLPTTTKTHLQKHLLTTTHDPQFQEKALFLDSIGLDSLNLLPPTAIAAASSLSDLKSLIDYLTSLGFSPPQLRRIFTMCPQILSLHITQIAPVFAFLLREVAVQSTHLPRAISSRPRLLLSDVENRLRPTLYFFQSIGIHQVNRHTNLLPSSVEEKYIPKIQFFENVGFSYHDSISMFRRFPPLFCYSVKGNYEPKFNYFVVEMGRDLKELKEFPQYFSFSLDKRIKPRHQVCVDSGVCFPLPILLKTKEDEFRKRLDVCCNSSMPKTSSPLWVSI